MVKSTMKNILQIILITCPMLLFSTKLQCTMGDPTIIFSNYNLENTLFMNRLAVQRIFTRKDTHWSNGDNITVFIKPMESIEHKVFVSSVLNMTLYRYQKSLETYTYTAKATPVTEVNNDDKMIVAIHTHPGSIGYVNYELVMNEKVIKLID